MTHCFACPEKDLRITALERVLQKTEAGANAFNWVGHEMGMRKKVEELEHKRGVATRAAARARTQSGDYREALGRMTRVLEDRKNKLHKSNEDLEQYKAKLERLHDSRIVRIIDWIQTRNQ